MPDNRLLRLRSFLMFYITLLVYFIASFFTGFRLWGFDCWGYHPLWIRFCIMGLCIIVGTFSYFKFSKYNNEISENETSTNTPLWFSIGVVLISGLAFYFFRTKTHFLGDGYTLISLLAVDDPLIKNREIGESLIHLWIKNLIGIQDKIGVIISYRIASISAGILFVSSTICFAYKYYDSFKNRIILTIGMLSGGYMLLFFGYVENYSFFVLTVAIFTYICVLILNKKIPKYWVIPSLGLTIFFHIFGVILIPGAIYVLLAGTPLGNRIKSLSKPSLYLIGTILMVGIGYFSFNLYSDISFFRFAILPMLSDKFTVDNYTMFSINHLLDILNLLFILLPGLGLLILFFLTHIKEKQKWNRDHLFLILLSLSGLGAILIFDPKLGMPRDWDLFSFTGIPLTLLLFNFVIMKIKNSKKLYFTIAILIIILGIQSIGARLGIINNSSIAEKQFKDYLYLDQSKGRNAWVVLINYYMDIGDTLKANIVYSERDVVLPERVKFKIARDFMAANKFDTAIVLFNQVLTVDGTNGEAWSSLGECYMFKKNYAKSIEYFKIAIALNPYKHPDLNNIGYMLTKLRSYEEAEKYLLMAYELKPSLGQISVNLASLYKDKRDKENYEKFITIALIDPSIPTYIIKEHGDYCISQMRFKEAAESYLRGLNKGLDTNYVINTTKKYPALKPYLQNIK